MLATLTSYNWGKGALSHATELLGPTSLKIIGALKKNGPPSEETYEEIKKIGLTLAEKIRDNA